LLPWQSILLFSLAAFIGYFFLSGFIWGAGYYPTSKKELDSVAKLLKLNENSRFYDLGSGYGRMIIGFAEKYGSTCVGVEIDPMKCWWTRQAIKRKKLGPKVSIMNTNFLSADLKDADGIFVFLSSETKIMQKLQEKLFTELKPGTRVVSYVHRFKSWAPEQTEGKLTMYSVPENLQISRAKD
jgi:precorrin-6B methylase 2